MIISVGYRVNSIRGTHFRIWATKQLKELIIKGFVLNNQKLKNPDNPFGNDYFDELLEQIRDIRSSENRFYRKITDIYALGVDYTLKADETRQFFKIVQNKLILRPPVLQQRKSLPIEVMLKKTIWALPI